MVIYPNPTTGRLTATLPAASGRTYRVLNALCQVQRQCPAEAANPAVEVGQLPVGLCSCARLPARRYAATLRKTGASRIYSRNPLLT